MKALIQSKFGSPVDVLEVREVENPIVRGDEVLVRVTASSVAGDDWHLMRGRPFITRIATGIFKPRNRIPGRDVAGVVEAIGPEVTEFIPGDEVFGWGNGVYAEYAAVPQGSLALKPENLTFTEAAVVPVTAFTALQALRDKAQVKQGDKVLIIGASGGVGVFAVQIARALGAQVTGIASTRNLQLMRSLGAHHVIDYKTEDFVESGKKYDVIVDMVANRSLSDLRKVMTRQGVLVMVGGPGEGLLGGTARFLKGLALSPFVSQKLVPLVHGDSKEDLLVLKQLIEESKVRPVVSATYELSAVPGTIGNSAGGHLQGKIAVEVGQRG